MVKVPFLSISMASNEVIASYNKKKTSTNTLILRNIKLINNIIRVYLGSVHKPHSSFKDGGGVKCVAEPNYERRGVKAKLRSFL